MLKQQQDKEVISMTDTRTRVTNRRQGERRNHHEESHDPERRVQQEKRTQANRRNS